MDTETAAAAQDLVIDLLDMDDKARAAGHSLRDILVKCGKDCFGIDITPDAPADEEPEAA